MSATRRVFLLAGCGLLLALAPACRTTVPAASAAAPELVRFERTACMGPCPVDALIVYTDGRMRYEGRAHGPRSGAYSGQLLEAERLDLIKRFELARFFELAPVYTSQLSDRPTYYLTFSLAGRQHRVKDYDRAPAVLRELEATLKKLIDAPRWQPAPDPPASK